jgi:uncharacterized protein
MIILAVIRKYPALTYFSLVFAISWGGIVAAVGPGALFGTEYDPRKLSQFVYVAALAGPFVAGVGMMGLVDGQAGFRDLVARLGKWRVDLRWYAIALLLAPVLTAAILLLMSLTSRAFLPTIVTTNDKAGLVLTGVIMGLVVGFCEELGWTGFATPLLRKRFGILATGLVIGLPWGLWHLPLFSGNTSAFGNVTPILYLAVLLFSFLPPYRVLMVWVHDRTQSVCVVILMHAALVVAQVVIIPPTLSGMAVVALDLIFGGLLWAIVLAIAVANGGQLSQQSPGNG